MAPPTTALRTMSASPREFQRLGLDYFDLFIAEWGVTGFFADGSSVIYTADPNSLPPGATPDIPIPTVAGIAIHPQSDFDRVLVETSVGVSSQGAPGGGGNQIAVPGQIIDVRRVEVSVDAPLIVPPPSVSGTSIKEIALWAHPDSLYRTFYKKRGAGGNSTFGPAMAGWISPLLGLRFFARPVLFGPQGRAPIKHPIERENLGAQPVQNPIVLGGGGAETNLAVIAVHGRKRVACGFRPSGTAVVTIRVAMLDMNAIAGSGEPIERNITSIAGLAADSTQWVEFAPHGDFLILYYTLTAGAGNLSFQVQADDVGPSSTVIGP